MRSMETSRCCWWSGLTRADFLQVESLSLSEVRSFLTEEPR